MSPQDTPGREAHCETGDDSLLQAGHPGNAPDDLPGQQPREEARPEQAVVAGREAPEQQSAWPEGERPNTASKRPPTRPGPPHIRTDQPASCFLRWSAIRSASATRGSVAGDDAMVVAVAAGDEPKNRLVPSGSNGMWPTSSTPTRTDHGFSQPRNERPPTSPYNYRVIGRLDTESRRAPQTISSARSGEFTGWVRPTRKSLKTRSSRLFA